MKTSKGVSHWSANQRSAIYQSNLVSVAETDAAYPEFSQIDCGNKIIPVYQSSISEESKRKNSIENLTHTTEKLLHIEDNISKIEEMIVRLTNIRAESEEIQEWPIILIWNKFVLTSVKTQVFRSI